MYIVQTKLTTEQVLNHCILYGITQFSLQGIEEILKYEESNRDHIGRYVIEFDPVRFGQDYTESTLDELKSDFGYEWNSILNDVVLIDEDDSIDIDQCNEDFIKLLSDERTLLTIEDGVKYIYRN